MRPIAQQNPVERRLAVIGLKPLIQRIISLRLSEQKQVTLLAACPNSDAVLEAAVKTAAVNNTPMLFAATLNQVDRDGGYTGWTPADFVGRVQSYAQKYAFDGPLYPCLDHGGPWLKDRHTLDRLSFEDTFQNVKDSLTACIAAGYQLLHIDPTVDRTLPPGQPLAVEIVVARTIELMEHAERERIRLGKPEIAYEVGTEEVHGGLVNLDNFRKFLSLLQQGLQERNLLNAWPCFIVAQVGTDLHTTYFDPQAAAKIYDIIVPYGSLAKGHYSDWVENAEAYPQQGMGGANVGPEFTAQEVLALEDLCRKERALIENHSGMPASNFMATLEDEVVCSNRWKKWLQPDEVGKDFQELKPVRRRWLLQTGARYIWTAPAVLEARGQLYENLSGIMKDPNDYVVDRIAESMDHYVNSFDLFDFCAAIA
jgi:tagatose-1,6-bisphosphate aldolase non-catalytic subunit AgaZ/GatZ